MSEEKETRAHQLHLAVYTVIWTIVWFAFVAMALLDTEAEV